MSELLLSVRNLSVAYEKEKSLIRAVNDLSFDLNVGETLGLVGETGAGKTTTAKAIMQIIPSPPGKITQGEILFEDQDLNKKKNREMRKIRGKDIAMIFQDPMTALNPVHIVGDQIAEMIRLHDKKLKKGEANKLAAEMLETVGIPASRFGDYPHQFSGGMKQRVVIAMALACNPKLLIADEPTTALDVTIQAQVLELMGDLKNKFQTSMIMITHDLGVVAEVCDKVAIMYAGRIVESGSLEDIYDHTAHPYTIGLFGSLPDLEHETERLQPVEGLMPDPAKLPTGCEFHPRCKFCTERCRNERPPEVEITPGHMVRCHRCSEK